MRGRRREQEDEGGGERRGEGGRRSERKGWADMSGQMVEIDGGGGEKSFIFLTAPSAHSAEHFN